MNTGDVFGGWVVSGTVVAAPRILWCVFVVLVVRLARFVDERDVVFYARRFYRGGPRDFE